MQVSLGDRAKDQVTGYEGICIARTQWLNGCVRITLQSSKLDKDGKPGEGQTFDEPQLTVTKARAVVTEVTPAPVASVAPARRLTGGPIPAPRQHAAPKR
jgi:hypothetical protein